MRIVIVGGGPGGYEAALVAADLGAEVTVVNDEGLGGACVLWDCVPSKTLLTSAQAFNTLETAPSLGVHFEGMPGQEVPRYEVDLPRIMSRVRDLALAQSEDIAKRVTAAGVRVVLGRGRIVDPHTVEVRPAGDGAAAGDGGRPERLEGDAILLATGSDPRRMDTAPTDGEVILSSQDVYKLRKVPEHLVVVGAGATGAEYATAFLRFGAQVTFIVSRDRILPTHDEDAALAIEDVFERRGLRTVKNARAAKVERVGNRGVVHLEDGRTIEGSH
ncbi:MAG TPA: FAD-dependent oxidoreductase, partial [Actinomycetes bacterium]|nr:FAD-dependent oxidoreductase [Actinomycetes bacterium]